MISKLIKEIMIAAKGDPNPDGNARLRAAVEAAKKASVPRDNIDRALKRAAGLSDEPIIYENVMYEGFAPHNVPVIVECVTDNKNRTAADIRVIFRRGQLGSIGAVMWMFERMGVIEGTVARPNEDIESAAIEAGAQNVEPLVGEDAVPGTTGARFFCEMADLDSVNKALSGAGWTITLSELSYQAKNPIEVNETQRKAVTDFLNDLDEHDDVHRVYPGLK